MEDKESNQEKKDYSKLNIYQKMSLASNEIRTIIKKMKVGEGTKGEYKAVNESAVLEAVKPIEYKFGIYSFPFDRKLTKEERNVFKNKYGDTENFVIRIETIYRFVNIDKPEEFIDVKTYGDGVDSMDKAPGKAMTYADKYALLKAYKITTGDDPDKNKSDKLKSESEKELQNIYLAKMSELIAVTDTDYEELLKHYGVKSNSEMSLEQLKEAIGILMKKQEKNKEEVF